MSQYRKLFIVLVIVFAAQVSSLGIISTIAGTGGFGSSGDGGPATAALFSCPRGVAVATNGDIYIADSYSNGIRKVL